MSVLGIIPARFASTRFPGKPLTNIGGKTMIQRVYEQALKAKSLNKVIVATDDDRIKEHVNDFGGNIIMTSPDHQSGTDRCNEVISKDNSTDIIINIQGDEPFVDPEQINLLVNCFKNNNTEIATLVKKVESLDELLNTNIPKVVLSENMQALYFSREVIPHIRGVKQKEWLNANDFYKHIGIYGYRLNTLKKIASLPPSNLEQLECLEQLRWLENNYTINVAITDIENIAIDTPEDLKKLEKFL